jgi:hypothetical protein
MLFKRIILALCVLALIGCGLSCNDDDGDKNPSGPGASSGSMSASVTGDVTHSFNDNSSASCLNEGTSFTIIGTSNNAYSIHLAVYSALQTGSYDVANLLDGTSTEGKALANFIVGTAASGNTMYFSTSGTVTVTEAGSRAKGTFSFDAFMQTQSGPSTVSVATGSFDVPVKTIN